MRHSFSILSVFMLIFIFVGCSSKKIVTESSTLENLVSTEQTAENEELIIWYDSNNKDYMTGLISQFVMEYPQINIITEDYSDMTIPDYRTKLAGELMTGGGPDIILSSHNNNNIVQNLTKLLQNDIFLDINTLDIDLSECNQAALSSGIYEGGRYYIPLNYSLGFLLTSRERLELYDLVCDGDLLSFANSISSIYNSNNLVFSDIFTIEALYFLNGMSLIDYANQTLTSSIQEINSFKRIAEAYSILFPNIFSDNDALSQYQLFTRRIHEYDGALVNAYLSGDLTFFSSPGLVGLYEEIRMINSVCKEIQQLGETPYLTRLPTIDGDAPSPIPNWFLLVNSHSKHIKEAACFIKSTLSMNSQYEVSSDLGIPVNNALINCMREYFCNGITDTRYPFPDLSSKEIYQYYFDQIDSMKSGVYTDVQTMGRLFNVFREYITGTNFDIAYEHAKNNVSFYLSE